MGESWSWVAASHTLDIWGNVSLLELNKRLEVTSVWPGGIEHDEEDEGSSRHSSVKFPATGTLEHELGAICGDKSTGSTPISKESSFPEQF